MEYIENREVEAEQLKAIFADMWKYSPSKICGMLGNAIIIPIYTSLLSPDQYGLYALSIAFLSFLCIIFSDWIGLSGLRFFRQHQLTENMPKYLTTLITMLTFNIIFMLVLVFLLRDPCVAFFKIPIKYLFAIILLIIPVAIRALLFQLVRAQLKSMAFTISTIINQILTICLSIIFIKFFNLGAISLLLGMGISITITDILLVYQSNVLSWFKPNGIEWKSWRPIYIYGIPIAATSLSSWVITQSNKFIMNSISGFSEVGIVGVAYGLTLPLLMTIFSIITVAAIPRIINMYEAKINVRPIISRFTGYYVMVSLPVIVIISMFSPEFVQIFSGNEKFYTASRLIPYFAFGTFFLALTDYTTLQYHLANKTYIDFIIKFISGVTGVVLNIWLIPKYGLEGVGIATLAANFLYFLLSVIIVLPGLSLEYPKRILIRMIISFMPYAICYELVRYSEIPAAVSMAILLIVFYFFYWILSKISLKKA